MTTPARSRPCAWASLLLLIAVALPQSASSQPPAAGSPQLAPEERTRLSRAAGDPLLSPWQRELMLRLARGEAVAVSDPSADIAQPEAASRAFGTDDGSWTELVPGGRGRGAHAAIFDPVRDRMVVIGGGDGSRNYDDVRALSLTGLPAWTTLTPTGTPPVARSQHSAIYDPVRDRVIVFGGYGDSHSLDDVWALSLTGTPAWTALTPTGTPPASRSAHAAIYDPVRDRMVVFGGVGGGTVFNDVWALSLADPPAWTALTPTGTPPVARCGSGAIYDSRRGRMVVFGGWDNVALRNDTWALSLTGAPAWTALAPVGPPPSARIWHSAIYDTIYDRMLVFGGFSDGYPSPDNDVWELSLAGTPTWSTFDVLGAPPRERYYHSAIYDLPRRRMIVYGGISAASCLGDVWALSTRTGAWSELSPVGTPPSPRRGQSAIYDPVRDRMVMFGGGDDASGYYLGDTWRLSLAGTPTWSRVAVSPGPIGRIGHTAFYDPARDRMVLFGGACNDIFSVCSKEVWGLPLAGTPHWADLMSEYVLAPMPRADHTAIYDPVRDRMVVFGGEWYGEMGPFDDVWALSLAGTPAWTRLAPTGAPPTARRGHTAIYDPARDRMVVFGGCAYPGQPFNEVWALSLSGGPAWTRLTPAGTPPSPRWSHSAIYDPLRDQMVVFGGSDSSGYRNDAWSLSLSGTPTWRALAPTGALPGARCAQSAIYDPLRDRMVVFGGTNGSLSYFGDVWALSLAGTPTDVQVALVSADVTAERVRLEWALGGGAGASATVQRRTASTPWQTLGTVSADGTGRIRYEDAAVVPGTRYGYRLGLQDGGSEVAAGETWVDVPAAASLALNGVRPNPAAAGGLWVRFVLPNAEPASLELYDVSGRQVESRAVGALGAGEHDLRLDSGAPLAPGVYLLRLTQGARSLTARAVVIR